MFFLGRTWATADIILEPPDAPIINRTLFALSTTIMGTMDERGLFPGSMKFASAGTKPKPLATPGVEKSSIWLL